MENSKFCKQCHQPVPESAPEGLCPECLAKVAVGSEPRAAGERTPPNLADVAAQFPQLEIIELLGLGGMAMVYKARQPNLDRFVALKILPIESERDLSFASRFEREAKALAKLNHPGIVTVYDFGHTRDYYFFVMEFVEGMNLRELLQTGSLSPQHTLNLVTQICAALQYAHDEKIVHRDIKPENILINKKGQAKIADFGLAKLLDHGPESNLTGDQTVMGTKNYMAPEQREQPLEVDHRADIYSLGVVFYEMLTGEVPMGRFQPPSKKVQVDVRLDEVVLHALEREPERRYQQASEIKTGVENIAATMKPSGGGKVAPGKKGMTTGKVVGVIGVAVLTVIVVLLALGLLVVVGFWTHTAAVQHKLVPLAEPAHPIKLNFVSVDSEETSGQLAYGEYAVDGNPDTYWHTQWNGDSPGLPHEIIVEIIPASVIKGFTYLPRQDESDHGTIKNYEFYVSNDGQNFGDPVKSGTFEPGKTLKTETFKPVKCRFVKLKAISEINGLAWTSAAEIGVVPASGGGSGQ